MSVQENKLLKIYLLRAKACSHQIAKVHDEKR